jgi:plastocyanin
MERSVRERQQEQLSGPDQPGGARAVERRQIRLLVDDRTPGGSKMRRRIIGLIATGAAGGLAAAVLVAATNSSAQYPPYPTYPTTTTSTTTYTQPPTTTTTTTTPPPTTTTQAPASSPSTGSTGHTVTIGDNFFRPPKLTVKRGTVMTWQWTGMNPHNVTFTKLHKHSKTQTSGIFRLRFSKKGTYHYLCTIHRFTGTIVVR